MNTVTTTTNTPMSTTVTSPTPLPSTQTHQGAISPPSPIEDTVTISTQARTMYTTNHENGSIRYPSTSTTSRLQALNDEVERMQLTYINAKVRGDQNEMGQAALAASGLRQQGATLGSEGTDATRALQNYYANNALVKEAIQSPSVMKLNKVIWMAKNDWVSANKRGDASVMKAASALSDNMRKMGGTVTETMTLQNLRAMNDEVERMQLQFINAKVRGEQNEMAQSMMSAARLREMGATLGEEGTAATRALQRYYDSNPLVTEAIRLRSAGSLNKAIWQAKNDFAYAQTVNDTATMKASAALSDNLRQLGGTIPESMSLQEARDMAFPDLDKLNSNVELAQMRYINAQVRGDQTGMHTALHEIQRMRELGATRGDEETSAIRALKRYYESDEFIKGTVTNRSAPALNLAIWKAKNDWLFAGDHNDSATKKAAELVSENLRLMGGTIDANVSIEEAYKIAFQGIESPSPTTDTPQTDEGVLEQLWGYVESFLGIPEIKASWEKLISPESSIGDRLAAVATLMFNIGMDVSLAPKTIYRLGKASFSVGHVFSTRTTAKETEFVTMKMTRTQIREHLQQRVVEIREQLPSRLKKSGNVGVARIEIKGIPSELRAHSQINKTEDAGSEGFVLLRENRQFKTKLVDRYGNIDSAEAYDRKWDTEAKILEEIALLLGDNTAISGKIDLFTERMPCPSCNDVIFAFRQKYPNIKLNIYSN